MYSTVLEYHAMGGAAKIFDSAAPEVMICGPAGTGKTLAVCYKIAWMCEEYPGIRVLIARKTRKSMTESVLVVLELMVLGERHTAIRGEAKRANRDYYEWDNGSYVAVGGMDNPAKWMSGEFDVVALFEATEFTLDDVAMVSTRLRGPIGSRDVPYRQMILDCNPGPANHHLRSRNLEYIESRHEDNPSVTEEYLDRLRNLPSVLRARLYEGKWVSAEGQVWDTFGDHNMVYETPKVRWYFGSMDFGYRDTGVLQVWGVEPGEGWGSTKGDDRIYRVAEVYRTEMMLDWWAETAEMMDGEFGLSAITCDPSRPDAIKMINDRIGKRRGRGMSRIARKAMNKRHSRDDMGGLDLVRWALSKNDRGPRMFFVRDALRRGIDPMLSEAKRPTCSEEEIPAYVWMKTPDGRPMKEETDPNCHDDGCDATRYAATFAWKRDLTPLEPPPQYAPGTLGHLFGHDKIMPRRAHR